MAHTQLTTSNIRDFVKKRQNQRFAKMCIILILVILFLRILVLSTMTVSGESMLPTYVDQEVVLVYKAAYVLSEPQVGDVVVAIEPSSNIHVIKRIAATEGMSIEYNGKDIVIEKGKYYLRGDNTGHTIDSDSYGAIPRDRIIGKVILTLIDKEA